MHSKVAAEPGLFPAISTRAATYVRKKTAAKAAITRRANDGLDLLGTDGLDRQRNCVQSSIFTRPTSAAGPRPPGRMIAASPSATVGPQSGNARARLGM